MKYSYAGTGFLVPGDAILFYTGAEVVVSIGIGRMAGAYEALHSRSLKVLNNSKENTWFIPLDAAISTCMLITV